jgi:hypothetical protein
MELLPHSPDLALNDFWPFPKIKPALKGWMLQGTGDIQKNVMMALQNIWQQKFKKVSNNGSIIRLSA